MKNLQSALAVLAAISILTLQGGCAGTTQQSASQSAAPGDPQKAQITVLYDAFGKTSSMQKDWGFAALVEYGGKRILFDTGNNSDVFARNVKAKGVDLGGLDFVVMSHRHGDHMGGLNYLLSVNSNVPIYVPKENFGVYGSALPGSFYRKNESLPPEMRYFDGKPPETICTWSSAAPICSRRRTRRYSASPRPCTRRGRSSGSRRSTVPASPRSRC